MTQLSKLCSSLLSDFFVVNEKPLEGQIKDTLEHFVETLDYGLSGNLEAKFYLLALDPGMGKSIAISMFLKAWRELSYLPASSILIGVSRLEEIKSFVEASGLPSSDFGVLTSDADMNALGLPQAELGKARVLFTTQQMIRSRTLGQSFSAAAEFHFEGAPRVLRLWDESIMPAEPIVIRIDDLHSLASPLRPSHPQFVTALEAFVASVPRETNDCVVTIPFALRHVWPWSSGVGLPSLSPDLNKTFANLGLVVGTNMLVRLESYYGLQLIGAAETLPSDIAPLITVDASGRVRTTYELWEKHRRNLVRLPAASTSFERLNIHVWNSPVGKDELRSVTKRRVIASAIAELLPRDPEGQWLVLTYKIIKDELKAAVERLVGAKASERIEWLTWGKHHGTNEFRDIDNIVIVGQQTYRTSDYTAFALAASGLSADRVDELNATEVREGEHRHHFLQAVCRASVRKGSGSVAGQCNAFLVTSMGNTERMLAKTFPGANLCVWKEPDEAPSGNVGRAMAYLTLMFSSGDLALVTKADLRDHLGIRADSLATHVLRKESFQEFLADSNLTMWRDGFRRTVCEFDPIAV